MTSHMPPVPPANRSYGINPLARRKRHGRMVRIEDGAKRDGRTGSVLFHCFIDGFARPGSRRKIATG